MEELVLELFALVNEKNELFRRQAELILLRRQQRLEEEHAEVEYQIRCLMCQPEATKTDFDKQREEALIQRYNSRKIFYVSFLYVEPLLLDEGSANK